MLGFIYQQSGSALSSVEPLLMEHEVLTDTLKAVKLPLNLFCQPIVAPKCLQMNLPQSIKVLRGSQGGSSALDFLLLGGGSKRQIFRAHFQIYIRVKTKKEKPWKPGFNSSISEYYIQLKKKRRSYKLITSCLSCARA